MGDGVPWGSQQWGFWCVPQVFGMARRSRGCVLAGSSQLPPADASWGFGVIQVQH